MLTQSGELLEADIIITATGFEMCIMGDINFAVDGEPVDFGNTFTYRGFMNSGVPNMVCMFGYLRTSWTMRVDLVFDVVCRMLQHMDEIGASSVTPTLLDAEKGMAKRPWISEQEFNPGYLKRSMHLLPKQGSHAPWTFDCDYYNERDVLPSIDLDEPQLVYQLGEESAVASA